MGHRLTQIFIYTQKHKAACGHRGPPYCILDSGYY
jgi:hypothetical protein